jgi:hypothetical protein
VESKSKTLVHDIADALAHDAYIGPYRMLYADPEAGV